MAIGAGASTVADAGRVFEVLATCFFLSFGVDIIVFSR